MGLGTVSPCKTTNVIQTGMRVMRRSEKSLGVNGSSMQPCCSTCSEDLHGGGGGHRAVSIDKGFDVKPAKTCCFTTRRMAVSYVDALAMKWLWLCCVVDGCVVHGVCQFHFLWCCLFTVGKNAPRMKNKQLSVDSVCSSSPNDKSRNAILYFF